MKIVLAGAFGNLGAEILRVLCQAGHEVVAADLKEREVEGTEGKYRFAAIDATNPETLKGLCDGADVVITTMGLTTASTRFTAYDIDYQGNLNLLNEAKAAGVKKFTYISVISCDEPGAEKVPMLHAKWQFENELKKSGLEYVIHRPTGYFYDIAKVFRPYVEKGEMQLLKKYGDVKANVVDCPEFAEFIVAHMEETNKVYSVGGKETWTYLEMAKMCMAAGDKPCIIKLIYALGVADLYLLNDAFLPIQAAGFLLLGIGLAAGTFFPQGKGKAFAVAPVAAVPVQERGAMIFIVFIILGYFGFCGTAKRAVTYFTRSLAKESDDVADGKVLVCRLTPGIMITDFIKTANGGATAIELPEKTKKIYNILGDYPETIVDYCVPRMLANTKNDARIMWLTNTRAFGRFLTAGFKKRDFFS